MASESTQLKQYKSLSSVGKALLPKAKKMHNEGMTWREIARHLGISHSILHVWRQLDANPDT